MIIWLKTSSGDIFTFRASGSRLAAILTTTQHVNGHLGFLCPPPVHSSTGTDLGNFIPPISTSVGKSAVGRNSWTWVFILLGAIGRYFFLLKLCCAASHGMKVVTPTQLEPRCKCSQISSILIHRASLSCFQPDLFDNFDVMILQCLCGYNTLFIFIN